jgi:hypothetical protein
MHNEELEPAFRQTAELLGRLGTRLENDPALNRPDPEIGRRYGDHLEATAHSIGELRWQVRENFAQFSSSEPRTAPQPADWFCLPNQSIFPATSQVRR